MKLLVLGKIPPPIGGVSIHVERLIEKLTMYNIKYEFYSLNNNLFSIFKIIINYKVIHLHSSNPYLRFLVSTLCKLTKKKLIITYHGNLGRFSKIKNTFDFVSIKYSTIPVVINKQSLKVALKYNKNAILISAFIAPIKENKLPLNLHSDLTTFIKDYKYVFCTNAYGLTYDKYNNEIYGGTSLIQIFNKYSNLALIFSDPSGAYYNYFMKNNVKLNRNIFFINYPHSFVEILKLSSCFIRATTTDGDALSIKEAIFLNKNVIASNCVDRPKQILLYNCKDKDDLENKIISITKNTGKPIYSYQIEEFDKLLTLYNNI